MWSSLPKPSTCQDMRTSYYSYIKDPSSTVGSFAHPAAGGMTLNVEDGSLQLELETLGEMGFDVGRLPAKEKNGNSRQSIPSG